MSLGQKLLVSVSGGCDSVAVLRLMLELQDALQLKLHVIHFDHGLRPESPEEFNFVESLAAQYDLPFHGRISQDLKTRKTGIQAAARSWRTTESQKVLEQIQGDGIVLAHHLDDQIETFLMRWLRGVHLSNLGAMKPRRDSWIRPLLGVHKQELIDYLKDLYQEWREDESNSSTKYLRNRVRFELVPLLQSLTSGHLEERISDYTLQSSKLSEWIQSELFDKEETAPLKVSYLQTFPIFLQENILYHFIRHNSTSRTVESDRKALDYQHILKIMELLQQGGSQWEYPLPGPHTLEKQGDEIQFAETTPVTTTEMTVNGMQIVWETQWQVEITLIETGGQKSVEKGNSVNIEGMVLPLRPNSNIVIRKRKAGDRFHPFWKSRPVKVKDFLRDQKIPLEERDRMPVVLVNEQIAALYPGHRSKGLHQIEHDSGSVRLHLKVTPIDSPASHNEPTPLKKSSS